MTIMGSIKRCAATIAIFFAILPANTVYASDAGHWSTVWATAMVGSPVPSSAVRPMVQTAPPLHGQTISQTVVLSAGGSRMRIRLSNTFGKNPLRIDATSVGIHVAGATAKHPITFVLHAVHFDGRADVVVPPGAARYSDTLDLPVHAGDTLDVRLYVAGAVEPTTWHTGALRNNRISTAGDYTGKADMPVAATTDAMLWFSGVDVQARESLPVLVTLGDSITNGFRSTVGATHGYPENLARRLRSMSPACRVAVLNTGIDGNEMSDRDGSYGPGESMQRRFARDVLGQSGVRFVLLLGGVNDIGETTMVLRPQGRTLDDKTIATNVIAAQQQITASAHAAGLRIFGATILPFEGTQNAYSEAGERARQQVNAWIRHRAPFDGLVDFDIALRDPTHPARLRPDLDSGDHIHPNDKGYAVMAASMPATLLGCRP